jgi:hypothetical protein
MYSGVRVNLFVTLVVEWHKQMHAAIGCVVLACWLAVLAVSVTGV